MLEGRGREMEGFTTIVVGRISQWCLILTRAPCDPNLSLCMCAQRTQDLEAHATAKLVESEKMRITMEVRGGLLGLGYR